MATPVPTDKVVTLKDEEYVELGKAAAEEVLRLSADMDNWLPTNHSDEQCQVTFEDVLDGNWMFRFTLVEV